MSEGMDVMYILKGAGATFLARHVAMDGMRAVETVKKAILNKGLSLVHMPYPCPTNFGSRHLGTRNQAEIYNWISDHAAPIGQEKADTLWATGVWHDATNSRPEFSEHIWAVSRKSGGQALYDRKNRNSGQRVRGTRSCPTGADPRRGSRQARPSCLQCSRAMELKCGAGTYGAKWFCRRT